MLPDPMNGEPFIKVPNTAPDEAEPFVQSLKAVPKSGLHNPLKAPERCDQGEHQEGQYGVHIMHTLPCVYAHMSRL